MKLLRAVAGRLDPWAALLLGVFVTLAVVILLATPGPWQDVVGVSRPGALVSSPPSDAAVFVLGSNEGECTGVLWVHADHQRLSLTVTVVPPLTQVSVDGGGFVPISRVVDDLGAAEATAALEKVLDVELEVGIALDRKALRLAVPPLFSPGDTRAQRRLAREGRRAWDGTADPAVAWIDQYDALRAALPRVALANMNIVAFSNYLLGFGPVQGDLDLQSTTSLARMIKRLEPGRLRVRACPAIVEVCRDGQAWGLDEIALHRTRHALGVGLTPPESPPTTKVRRRPARVLVVVPDADLAGAAYTAAVRERLAESAGAPVDVRVVGAPPKRLLRTVQAALARWEPLAVLVAPVGVREADEAQTEALRRVTAFLARRGQPAVVGLADASALAGATPAAETPSEPAAVAEASGLPVSRWRDEQGRSPARPAVARAAARAHVETLTRACWPGTLAPRLASTRSGFSYAACLAVNVLVRAETSGAAERLAARLTLWGYQAAAASFNWRPPQDGTALYYREGRQRAAQALGGDLGLEPSQIVAAESAPTDLTLIVEADRAE